MAREMVEAGEELSCRRNGGPWIIASRAAAGKRADGIVSEQRKDIVHIQAIFDQVGQTVNFPLPETVVIETFRF